MKQIWNKLTVRILDKLLLIERSSFSFSIYFMKDEMQKIETELQDFLYMLGVDSTKAQFKEETTVNQKTVDQLLML
jgi:hypothetical protein